MKILVLALAGGLGTLARYGVDAWVSSWAGRGPAQPTVALGTFLVNVSGCFLIGVATVLFETAPGRSSWLTPEWRDAATIGFCGGYTTFSTYALQSLSMARAGLWAPCAVNVVGSNVAGLAAVYLGAVCARIEWLTSSS